MSKRLSFTLQLDRAPQGSATQKWHLLFPLGKRKHRSDFPSGIDFGGPTLAKLAENFVRVKQGYLGAQGGGGFGLPVTFGHVREGALPEAKRAAGWIEDLRLDEQGLSGLIRWTDEGKDRIGKDEFRFLSPEFTLEHMDPDLGANQGPTFFGAALVNDPFLQELPRVAASQTPQGARMDKAKLLAMLGLKEDTTDEELERVLKERLTAKTEPPPELVAAKAELSKLAETVALDRAAATRLALEKSAVEAKVIELTRLNAEAQDKLEKLALSVRESQAKAFCAELIRTGRMVPAKSEVAIAFAMRHGLTELEALLKDSPPIVDLGVRGTAEAGAGPKGKDEARVKFFSLVDEETAKAKVSPEVATKRVRLAQPELAKLVFGG